MLGMCSDCKMGAMARVTALSAVPSIATSPWLAILRASSVPTVGSPWSSSRDRVIFRPSMPSAALAWSTASLTPRYSNWPRSLDDPLCASTTAILIGPEGVLLLPPAAADDEELPGALHAVAARPTPAKQTAAKPMRYLDMVQPPDEVAEKCGRSKTPR